LKGPEEVLAPAEIRLLAVFWSSLWFWGQQQAKGPREIMTETLCQRCRKHRCRVFIYRAKSAKHGLGTFGRNLV